MLSPAEWTALGVSLKVAALALVLMAVPGIPLAWLLARRSFFGRTVVDGLSSLPLVLPPVVTGTVLLWLLAPGGPVGGLLHRWFDVELLFTWPAASLAAAAVAFPLFLRSVRTSLENVSEDLEQAAANLGASPLKVAVTVTLPLARPGLVAGALLGFSRALGEFGATILVAGNIPGRTQTVPLAIFSLTQTQQLREIWPLVLTISAFSFVFVVAADRYVRGRRT